MTGPTPRVLLLGREPAMIAELIAALLVIINLFFLPDFNVELQGAINAVILAASSIYIAVRVKSDNLLPLVVGAFKTVVALLVTFGVDLTQEQQAAALTFAAILAGAFVRSNVQAPVTVDGQVLYNRPAGEHRLA